MARYQQLSPPSSGFSSSHPDVRDEDSDMQSALASSVVSSTGGPPDPYFPDINDEAAFDAPEFGHCIITNELTSNRCFPRRPTNDEEVSSPTISAFTCSDYYGPSSYKGFGPSSARGTMALYTILITSSLVSALKYHNVGGILLISLQSAKIGAGCMSVGGGYLLHLLPLSGA